MNADKEILPSWHTKTELERTALSSLHGPPELKKQEKRKYLGVFRENVMIRLSMQQVKEPGVYPEVLQSLRDKRSAVLIANGMIDTAITKKYQALARKTGKSYKVVAGDEYDPDAGIVVASRDAVNREKVEPENRTLRLRRLGATDRLIQSAGKKVCRRCLQQILAADPTEQINYKTIGLIDRIAGDTCPAHES
jgi:uncharacterized protein YueI